MKRRHRRHLLYLIIFLIAFIILPTGTPEDLFTTVIIIKLGGLRLYVLLAILSYLALVWVRGRGKK